VDRAGYLAVSVDVVVGEEMARRSLIPVVAGLSPLEGADLVHAEAQHIAKRLAARAIADGRDVLLHVTMPSEPPAGSDWPAILASVAARDKVAFPSGPIFSLVGQYAGGKLTLAELARRLHDRGLARAEPACPPGLEQARTAIDDLEAWTGGSFDEIVLGCDLGLLSDHDYKYLVVAIAGCRHPPG
jgi:hypothetical protein